MPNSCFNCKKETEDLEHPRVYIAPIKQWATNKNFKLCGECRNTLQDHVEKGYEEKPQNTEESAE